MRSGRIGTPSTSPASRREIRCLSSSEKHGAGEPVLWIIDARRSARLSHTIGSDQTGRGGHMASISSSSSSSSSSTGNNNQQPSLLKSTDRYRFAVGKAIRSHELYWLAERFGELF